MMHRRSKEEKEEKEEKEMWKGSVDLTPYSLPI